MPLDSSEHIGVTVMNALSRIIDERDGNIDPFSVKGKNGPTALGGVAILTRFGVRTVENAYKGLFKNSSKGGPVEARFSVAPYFHDVAIDFFKEDVGAHDIEYDPAQSIRRALAADIGGKGPPLPSREIAGLSFQLYRVVVTRTTESGLPVTTVTRFFDAFASKMVMARAFVNPHVQRTLVV